MDPGVDPTAIPVAEYEEDLNEAFTGPNGIASFFNEDYDDEEDYYDGNGYQQPDPLEDSAPQRTAPMEAGQAETVSGHTQKDRVGHMRPLAQRAKRSRSQQVRHWRCGSS